MPASPARIFRSTPTNLTRLAARLRRGDLVAVPSETVYGLAANALDADACGRIFEAKQRPATDPLIVHLASAHALSSVAVSNDAALALAKIFWPGPLTLVLPKKPCISDRLTAGKPTVAVRVPAHRDFRKLIQLSGCPLAAPSANPFGYISPTTARHVQESLIHPFVRAILDGGPCSVGVESTIINLCDPAHPTLLRPGGLALEKIEAILGQMITRPRQNTVAAHLAAPAPGMLAQHYSPHTPLCLHVRIDAAMLQDAPDDEAFVLLRRSDLPAPAPRSRPNIHWLSEKGEGSEIARHLFAKLRELDQGRWTRLHVEIPQGQEGLAPAIRDRLSRAAAKR